MEKLKTFQSGRKILSLCLSLCMILTVFSNIGLIASAESAYAPEEFALGSGTADDPYQISTVGHLVKMVQSGGKDIQGQSLYYKLTADIDLNPTENWVPQNGSYQNWASIIPGKSVDTTFCGYLDGSGKTISHLYVKTGDNQYENYAGLIQAMSPNSWIKNLTIDSFYSSGLYAAGVVGMTYGERTDGVTNFENITVKNGTVISTNQYGSGAAGILSYAYAKTTFNTCKAIGLNISSVSGSTKRGAICGVTDPDGTTDNAELIDCAAIGCRGVSQLIGGAKGNGENGTVKYYDETVNYAGGSGIKADPYQIATVDQLYRMVYEGGKTGDAPAYYVLKNDIVFNEIGKWSPDADNTKLYEVWNTPSADFEGNFNGNGYTISNLYIKGNGFINVALDGAVITNVRFENIYVSGQDWVGTLVGTANTITVSNVMIINSQLVRTANWGNKSGGIVGLIWDGKTPTFSNCAVIKTDADGAISGCGDWNAASQNITGCWAVECSKATRFCAGKDVTTTKSYFITDKSSIKGAAAKENMPLDYTMTWKLGAEGEYPSVRAFNAEIWDGNKDVAVNSMQGSGTKANPYIITNGAQLYAAVNATGELYFEINNDIYLGNPGLVYLGVGSNNWFNNNGDVPFIGHIDGKGHTVYGVYSKADNYWGASGFVRILGMGGTLKNIRISHSYIESKQYLTGALTGMVSYIPDKGTEYTHPAEISGCSVVESSVIATEAYQPRIGALVGYINNTYYADNSKGTVKLDVKDCYTSNNVLEYTNNGTTCDNDANAGGIIGDCGKPYDNAGNEIVNEIIVSNCYTDGNVPFGANASDYFNHEVTNVYAVNVAEGIEYGCTVGSYGDMTGLFNAGSAWYQVGENPARLIVNTVDFEYPDFDGDGIDSAPDAASLTAIKKALLGIKGYNLNNAVGNCNGDQDADGVDIFNILDLVRLKKYLSNESGVELKKKTVTDYNSSLPQSLEDRTGYSLTWHDEFSTPIDVNTDIDRNWQFQWCGGWPSDVSLQRHADYFSIVKSNEGSYLSMRALRQDSHDREGNLTTYTYAPPITTCGKMSYQYGYLEIKAKVPLKKGTCPAFWLKSMNDQFDKDNGDVKLGFNPNKSFEGEIDVFETFGYEYLIPNIHKFWNPISGLKGVQDQANNYEGKTTNYYFTDNSSPDDWHTYGCEWTPNEISMYVDGNKYNTYDLNEVYNYNASWAPDWNKNWNGSTKGVVDKSGFNAPLTIVLSMGLITKGLVATEPTYTGRELVDSDYNLGDTVAEFAVDYIRLYQKADGKLWTKY